MTPDDFIIQAITPTTHDLGDFKVHRSLPVKGRTMVGPFIFFDQAGPARIAPGQGIDVRPHPHINLATVTYMYEGSFLHRDSLGSLQQRIENACAGVDLAGPKARRSRGGRIAGESCRSPYPFAARSAARLCETARFKRITASPCRERVSRGTSPPPHSDAVKPPQSRLRKAGAR